MSCGKRDRDMVDLTAASDEEDSAETSGSAPRQRQRVDPIDLTAAADSSIEISASRDAASNVGTSAGAGFGTGYPNAGSTGTNAANAPAPHAAHAVGVDGLDEDIRLARAQKFSNYNTASSAPAPASSSSAYNTGTGASDQLKLKWQPFYNLSYARLARQHNERSLFLRDLFTVDSSSGSAGGSGAVNSIEEVLAVDFMFDLSLLAEECPMLCDGTIPVLMLHGMNELHEEWELSGARDPGSALHANLSHPFAQWRFAQVRLADRWGTHHTKMFVIFFKSGVRVVVHTANLLHRDVHDMTNAFWVQDFPLKQQSSRAGPASSQSLTPPPSVAPCAFENSLCDYLQCYYSHLKTFDQPPGIVRGFNANVHLQGIVHKLRRYDFSAAEVVLIPSVPGRHSKAEGKFYTYGHTAVRAHFDSLKNSGAASKSSSGSSSSSSSCSRSSTAAAQATTLPLLSDDISNLNDVRLVMQVSSIGSVGKNSFYLRQLADSLAMHNPVISPPGATGRQDATAEWTVRQGLELIFPTLECVRNSFRGYATGNSIPVRNAAFVDDSGAKRLDANRVPAVRPCYTKSLCKWDGSASGRERHPPHIKTFFQYVPATGLTNQREPRLLWFILTSSNLSQAAWGLIEGTGPTEKLYIKSYEMGVLFVPQQISQIGRSFSCTPLHPLLGLDVQPVPKVGRKVRFFVSPHGISRVGVKAGADAAEMGALEVFFNIPFRVPPVHYGNGDVPWTVDAQTILPDVTGARLAHMM